MVISFGLIKCRWHEIELCTLVLYVICSDNGSPQQASLCDITLGTPDGLGTCISTATSDPTAFPFPFSPYAVAVHGSFAYISGQNGQSVIVRCLITPQGLKQCQDACPTGGCGAVPYGVEAMAVTADFSTAYLADSTGPILACDIDSSTGLYTACAQVYSFTTANPYGMAVIGSWTSFQTPTVFILTSDYSGGGGPLQRVSGCIPSGPGSAATMSCSDVLWSQQATDGQSFLQSISFGAM